MLVYRRKILYRKVTKFHLLLSILFSLSALAYGKEKIPTQILFSQKSETDSLTNPNHFYYLSDLPLKKAGELILNDSIKPSDNFITFALMDTVSGCKKSDLNFYLKVFEKILNYADGALAEAVGSYTLNFIKKRPADFINHIGTLNDEQIKTWADYTFVEMYFTYPAEELKTKCRDLVNMLRKIKVTKSVACFEKELNNRVEKGV